MSKNCQLQPIAIHSSAPHPHSHTTPAVPRVHSTWPPRPPARSPSASVAVRATSRVKYLSYYLYVPACANVLSIIGLPGGINAHDVRALVGCMDREVRGRFISGVFAAAKGGVISRFVMGFHTP